MESHLWFAQHLKNDSGRILIQQPDSQQSGAVNLSWHKKKTPLQAMCQANDEETKKIKVGPAEIMSCVKFP